jgi:hypothetical protein
VSCRRVHGRIELDGPRFANCIIWAIGQWWRKGGYIIVRRARGGVCGSFYPHVLWSRRLKTVWSYKPVSKRNALPIYRGRVYSGDWASVIND